MMFKDLQLLFEYVKNADASKDDYLRAIVEENCLKKRILERPEGTNVSRQALENYNEKKEPDRFSSATLKSLAQNLNASWTDSGHLSGKARIRVNLQVAAETTTLQRASDYFLSYASIREVCIYLRRFK